MDNEKYIMMLQEATDRSIRNEGRIKKLETENNVLHQLATSVAVMAEQMKGLNQNVTTLAGEVEEIKDKPRARWDSVITAVITAVVGAIIGFALGGIL